jgi:hypothetical protein
MDKPELLERMRGEHMRLEGAVAGLTRDELTRPGVSGAWSAKDVLAHVTWWEQRLVEALTTGAGDRESAIGRVATYGFLDQPIDLDVQNAGSHRQDRDVPLGVVRHQRRRSFAQIEALVAAMPEEVLQIFAGLDDAPSDVPHRVRIRRDTYEHYREHADAILAWRRCIRARP